MSQVKANKSLVATATFHLGRYALRDYNEPPNFFLIYTQRSNSTQLIPIAPFNSSHNMRPEAYRHHPNDPHFIHTERVPACDHCIYFKGIVYRSLARQHLTSDDLLVTRYDKMANEPRSLQSVALKEEAIERREHAKYVAWSRSLAAVSIEAQAREAEKMAKSVGLYTVASDTLMQWIDTSTKEELLAWLEKNGDERDNMDTLRHEGIFDLREYFLNRCDAKRAIRKKATKKSPAKAKDLSVRADSTQPVVKKPDPRRDAIEQRLQAHKSLKPPQAALRERDELRRWYDSKKAHDLKDELRERGIRPVPSKKVDMIVLLVEDDKNGS
ncbi:hypothetical protein BU25DRAFT_469657 [Macroventuria anomochaeta]|uniref:Uncharacterized protein n=1 Tax=Macroventuria anomochaeta TaxID=301207 RepID=A0ACB6RZL1_9PLEO|nr:uncharacterized protein BU25DRAFT_469657 [Macroventuria anomochaeta]KAF2627214.1 hypothetical protein BU25DRAFT_469657 [Macroventuria anomochaeta]